MLETVFKWKTRNDDVNKIYQKEFRKELKIENKVRNDLIDWEFGKIDKIMSHQQTL